MAKKTPKPPKSKLDNEIDPISYDGYLMPGRNRKGEIDRQKKQEFNRQMGHVAEFARKVATKPEAPELADYLSRLAEDETRYINRRRARSISLSLARDVLFFRQVESLCSRVFRNKITPRGYADKKAKPETSRIINLPLSDLHIGATLFADENPEGFDFTTAGRRLARVVAEAIEFKSQHRDRTHLNLGLNGDLFEGFLGHDIRDGAPLAEQWTAALRFLADSIAHLAAAFPSVSVHCSVGNHGRNIARHEGRATVQKFDSYETMLHVALQALAAGLPNVRFHIPKAPVCMIPIFDKWILQTHGDTEIQLGDPDKAAALYERALDKINAKLTYEKEIAILSVGHFHKPRVMRFRRGVAVVNGALVPPNGHARSAGYDNPTGQLIWESVPQHPFGDSRFIEVGTADDRNASLDRIIRPFSW